MTTHPLGPKSRPKRTRKATLGVGLPQELFKKVQKWAEENTGGNVSVAVEKLLEQGFYRLEEAGEE